MDGISDIYIIGLDDRRPPTVTKSPYIDLAFELSHQAPKDWCGQFNELLSKSKYKPKIEPDKGLFVDAWVRESTEIPAMLNYLNEQIGVCTENYIARIKAAREAVEGHSNQSRAISPEQAELNAIVAKLEFQSAPLEEAVT